MKLLNIELKGFKSFCDKTLIHFDNQKITAIIGPNGCGKSNVVDAVRWVLGEQSSKMLRGSKMQDVIFNGSETREALSFCEVSLNFENDLKNLPRSYNEFGEIALSRKLYANGESEYQVNQTACRLLDIKEILLSSGSTSRGYSIIEQNKISNIITSKPENLREIIDEAASILGYKLKRKEAEKKIDSAKQNLTRIADRLDIILNQSSDIKEQAALLEQYEALNEKINYHTKCSESIRWQQFSEEYKSTFLKKEQSSQSILRLDSQTQQTELALQKHKLTLEELQSKIKYQEQKIHQIEKNIASLESNIKLNKLSLEHEKAQIQNQTKNRLNAQSQLALIESQKKQDEADFQNLNDRHAQITNQKNERVEQVKTAKNTLAKLEESLESKEKQAAALKIKKLQSESKIEKNTQIQKQFLFQHQYQEELKTIAQRLDQLKEDKEQNRIVIEGKQNDGFTAINKTIEEEKKELDTAKNLLKEASQSYKQFENDVNAKKHEITKLDDLLKNHGYLHDQNAKKFHSILSSNQQLIEEIGYVGSVISYFNLGEERLSLKQYLLTQFQNTLVFKYFDQAERIKHLLNEHQIHHIEIYFLDLLVEHQTSDHQFFPFQMIVSEKGAVSKSLDLKKNAIIDFEEQFFLSPYKTIVYYDDQHHNNLFDYQKSKKQFDQFIIEIEDDKNELLRKEERVFDIEETIEIKNTNINKAIRDKLELESALKNKKQEQEYLNKSITDAIKEKEALEDKIKKSSVDTQQLDDENQELFRFIGDITHQIVALELQTDEVKNQYEDVLRTLKTESRNLRNDELDLARIEEKRAHLKKEIAQYTAEFERYNHQLNNQGIDQHNDTIAALEKTIESEQIEIEEKLLIKLNEINLLKEIEAALHQEQLQLDELAKQLKLTQSQNQEGQKTAFQINIELDRIETRIKNIETNLMDQYQIRPNEFINSFNAQDYDFKEKLKEIQHWRSQLNQMPQVNFMAKESYQKIKTEVDFLTEQKDDLSQSIKAIQQSIEKLNLEIEKTFSTTFQEINLKLEEIVPLIFKGGYARLRLVDDKNILESGVDIDVKLPGKKLSNLSLMSGGEKAMTALAFLFAMFLTKPSPFCILDEVDAPLDDANTNKFCNLIRKLSSHTQFIIITHSKITIESSEQLYGVTMQEPGVSKIVSVNLETLIGDGEAVALQ